MEGFRETMTHGQTAKYLKLGKSTPDKMARESKIPTVKIKQGNNKKVIIRLLYNQELFGHNVSKITENYTHVSTKKLSAIKNPFDNLLEGGRNMISPRGIYIRNIANIIPNLEYIRNAYMNELSEMRLGGFELEVEI